MTIAIQQIMIILEIFFAIKSKYARKIFFHLYILNIKVVDLAL